jgi:hypothetical protein
MFNSVGIGDRHTDHTRPRRKRQEDASYCRATFPASAEGFSRQPRMYSLRSAHDGCRWHWSVTFT